MLKSRSGLVRSLTLVVYLSISGPSSVLASSESATAPATSPSLSKVIETLRPSIVHIYALFDFQYREGSDPSAKSDTVPIRGTGFIVDAHGHIATAAHVVDSTTIENSQEFKDDLVHDNRQLIPATVKLKEIQISFPEKSDRNFQPTATMHVNMYNVHSDISAHVLVEDVVTDIAILACNKNPLEHMPTVVVPGHIDHMLATMPHLATEIPEDGEMIAASGFPLASIPVLTTNVGWIATSYYRDEKERSLYLGSIHTNAGDSGSPVYRASDGAILGCVVSSRVAPDGSSSGLTVIVPVQRFLEMLTTSTSSLSNETLASELQHEVSRSLDPAEEHLLLGNEFHKKQQFTDAAIEYRAALGLKVNAENAAKLHYYLGHTLKDIGLDDEAAVAEYQQGIALDPAIAHLHNGLGVIYADRGQLDSAIAEFRAAIAINPSDPEFHDNLAHALGDKGDFDDCVAESQIVLRLKPDFPNARANLERAIKARDDLQNRKR